MPLITKSLSGPSTVSSSERSTPTSTAATTPSSIDPQSRRQQNENELFRESTRRAQQQAHQRAQQQASMLRQRSMTDNDIINRIHRTNTLGAKGIRVSKSPLVRTTTMDQGTQMQMNNNSHNKAIQSKTNFEKFNLEEFLANYFDNRINTRIPYTRQEQMPVTYTLPTMPSAQPIMPSAQPIMPSAQPIMPDHGRALMLLQEITRLDRQALKQPLNKQELDYYNRRVQELFKLTGNHFPSVDDLYKYASKDIRKNPYLNPWHKDYNPKNLKPTPEEKRIIYERLKKQLLLVTEKFKKDKRLLDNTEPTAQFLFNNDNITKINTGRDRDKTKKEKEDINLKKMQRDELLEELHRIEERFKTVSEDVESQIAEMLESRKARERERKRQGREKIDVRGGRLPYYVNNKNQTVYLREANPNEQNDAPFIDRLTSRVFFPREPIINRSLNFLKNKLLLGR